MYHSCLKGNMCHLFDIHVSKNYNEFLNMLGLIKEIFMVGSC